MGRPIKKEFIGKDIDNIQTEVVITSAFIPGSQTVSTNVDIIKQKGTGRYIVTDGTNTGLVTLVDGSNGYTLKEGEALMAVSPFGATTTGYSPSKITINNGGTLYKINDVITVPNIGTIKVTNITPSDPGGVLIQGNTDNMSQIQYTVDHQGVSIPGTGGSGTGATFDVYTNKINTFLPSNVTLNSGSAGTGYKVNDTITLANVGTLTVLTVGSNGELETFSSALTTTSSRTDMAGTTVSQSATSGSGTGAVFTVVTTSTMTYPVKSTELNNPGQGYKVGDVIVIGDNLGTYVVTRVSKYDAGGKITSASNKVINTTSSTDMAGTNIPVTGGSGSGLTIDVTSTTTSVQAIEYARKIFDRTVVTFKNNVYTWNLFFKAYMIGQSDITTKNKGN